MTRRNIELLLLVIASPIVIVLFAMMVVTGGQELSVNTLGVPLGIFAAFVVAHIAVRWLAPAADPAILPISFALSGIGIAFVTRIVPDLAVRQVIWLFAAVAVMVAVLALVRNLDKLANYKYTLMIVGILLLLSPMLPVIGEESGGGQLWLRLGPFSFQPGEIAKILIVFFIAAYLAANREMLSVFTQKVGPLHLPSLPTLLPLIVMWALAFVVVVLEKDLGLALVLFSVFVIMLYVATGKKLYLVASIGLAAIAAVALYFMMGHVQTRVSIWLDPFAAAQGGGFQLVQSLFSMADGDLFGTGIGRGMGGEPVAAGGIPVAESDFIFPVIAEEAGLMGAAGLLLLYLCFAIRGIVTAARAKSDVSSFVAVGLTSIIVLQAFIIVGGVTRLIPLTGITLPFVSQGGSSLIASFMIVAFLLRCGDEGTGVGEEMRQTGAIGSHGADAVLGRVALGKRLTGTMMIFSLLFAVLVANLTYLMIIKAPEYQNMPSNNHTIAREAQMERGTISTVDGTVLAQSVRQEDGSYRREYPAGTLAAHIVGYASQKFGTAGIEAAYNDALRGEQNFASFTDVVNSLAGIQTKGNDVALTIDSRIQQAAQDALEGQVGAVVAMNPETGAVYALASSPTYDAADYEALLTAAAEGDGNDSSELYNRATQALYAPGSTFKMVTLAAALQDGIAKADSEYDSPGEMEIGNAPVTNVKKRSYGKITLAQAMWYSSNTVFGQVGVQLGSDLLVNMACSFGFNEAINFDLPLATSLMPDPAEMTEWETAWAACGEPVGEHESPAGPQATVMQMCLVGCAIANEGAIMQPYLVDGIYNANGERGFTPLPVKLKQAIDPKTAEAEIEVMKGVVVEGTGGKAAIDGVEVAGKTAPTSAATATTTVGSWGLPPPMTRRSWWLWPLSAANRARGPRQPMTLWRRLSKWRGCCSTMARLIRVRIETQTQTH